MPVLRTLAVLFLLAALANADELRTLDNKTISGTVVGLDDKEVAIKTADGQVVKTPLENVLALDLRPVKGVAAGTPYTEVRLIDDTVLMCRPDGDKADSSGVIFKGKNLQLNLLSGQALEVPQALVVTILKNAQNPVLRKAWDGLLADKLKRDRVVIFKNDSVNALDGTLGESDAKGEKIAFQTADGDSLQVPLTRLSGLIFYRQEQANAKEPLCTVYDIAGNAIVASKVVAEGNKLFVVGVVPKLNLELDRATIAKFDYNMGKLAFLSDMVPSKVVEKSGVGLIVTHRKDVNLDGEPIVLDRAYPKGLSVHAYTELEFDLKGRFKKFSCVLGVDTRVGSDSQAKVVIEIDGRTKFSEIITAKTVVPVNLDITKASTIRIIVSSSNFLDLHDHVTIAAPKVTQ